MENMLRLLFVSLMAFPLVGCGMESPFGSHTASRIETEGPVEIVSAEDLLNADGFLSFAGLKTDTLSPLVRHAHAKDMVDPSKTRGHFAYTDYLTRADMMARSKHRELSLQNVNGTFRISSLQAERGVGTVPAPEFKPFILPTQIASVAPGPSLDDSARYALSQAPKKDLFPGFSVPEDAVYHEVHDDAVLPPSTDVALNAPGGVDPYSDDAQLYAGFVSDLKAHAPDLNVVNMRMGDYEDKTRLVLDLSAAAKFDYALNADTRDVLTVHISDASWDLDTRRLFAKHPLVESYEVIKTGAKDITLEVKLKQPSKMLMSGFVRPDKNKGYRIFFDMAAL